MRQLFRYILIVAVLVSCSQTSQQERLLDVDRLMMSDVDSARAMLTDMREDMLTAEENVRNYYNLLCVKNDDKALVTHTSDSLIGSVVQHFEQSADKKHLAEAYYYAGRCNADMMQGEKALFYFQLALMEDSFYVTDYLRSRIFAQMGYIYQHSGLIDEAMNMHQMARIYCEQSGDTLGMRFCNEDMEELAELSQRVGIDTLQHAIGVFQAQKINEKARAYKLMRQNRELKERDRGTKLWPYALLPIAALLLIIYIRRKRGVEKPQPTRRSFYDKELGDLIATRLSEGKTLRPADWSLIEERLHASVPTFKDSLYKLYNFSDTEYRICMLIRLEVSPSNIAKLLAIGTSSVSQSRLRMQQKVFGGQGTAKDWDNFVLSL